MEKVSVIIPTYNRSHTLKRAVESVLGQTFDNFELLIVDDGSEDDTKSVVDSIQDKRIRYIKLKENRGAAGARNEGIRRSECSLIAFQDSDDVWRPEKLERQMIYWEQHPECALVYCDYLAHAVLDEETVDEWVVSARGKESEKGIFLQLLLENSIGTPTMLVKKECFLEVGGFDDTLRSLEDWDLAVRIAEKYSIGYINEILLDVYPGKDGISMGLGAYFDGRSRMIARYREQMTEAGIFDRAVNDLFQMAQKRGVLETVKRMLLLYMGQ